MLGELTHDVGKHLLLRVIAELAAGREVLLGYHILIVHLFLKEPLHEVYRSLKSFTALVRKSMVDDSKTVTVN